jgi:hypothetical protein
MLAVGVPQDAATSAAAAASLAPAMTAQPAAPEAAKTSFWRRMLVIGTGLAGAWSAWNLYGESVVRWGSGMMQWLEGGGDAAADVQQQQQQQQQQQYYSEQPSSSLISSVTSSVPSHPSASRMVLRGNAWVEEGTEQQQPSVQAPLPDANERQLQAEALKVTCHLLPPFMRRTYVTPSRAVSRRSGR